jgi:hypothetical protein
MKKVAILIISSFILASCAGADPVSEVSDSTVVDSVAVEQVVADTNTAHIPVSDPVGGGSVTHEQPIK